MAVCFGLTEGTAIDWSSLHVTDVGDVSPSAGAWGLACVSGFMVVIRLFGDAVVERVGRVAVVRFGAVCALVGYGLTAFTSGLAVILVGWCLVGLGVGLLAPQIYGLAGHIGGAAASGFVVSFGYAAFLVGPALIGFVAAHTDLQRAMLVPVVTAVGLIVLSARLPADPVEPQACLRDPTHLASYCGRMPSLQHAVASRVVPILRRNMSADDIPAMRDALLRANRAAQEVPPKDVRRTHEETVSNVHGFPVFTLSRPGAENSGPTVLYLHGGRLRASRRCPALAVRDPAGRRPGRACVLPVYPLAPEFTVEDSFERDGRALRGGREPVPRGGGPRRRLRRRWLRAGARRGTAGPGWAQPERLVLIAPWVDLTSTTPGTLEAAERDPWLSYPHLADLRLHVGRDRRPRRARRPSGQPRSRRPRRAATDADVLRHPRPAAARLRRAVRAGGGRRLAAGVRRGARA